MLNKMGIPINNYKHLLTRRILLTRVTISARVELTMGHKQNGASRILRIIKRAVLFIAVWTAAILVVKQAVCLASQHQKLSDEVRILEEEYRGELSDYAGVLAENERIASDHETQISYLKDKFGYTEPDETPIIIIRDE